MPPCSQRFRDGVCYPVARKNLFSGNGHLMRRSGFPGDPNGHARGFAGAKSIMRVCAAAMSVLAVSKLAVVVLCFVPEISTYLPDPVMGRTADGSSAVAPG
jgi:hypothetical protein